MKNKYGQEQLELRVKTETGSMPLVEAFQAPVGTSDMGVPIMLAESIRLKASGGCWCTILAKQRRERHNAKRCACRCHVRKRKVKGAGK